MVGYQLRERIVIFGEPQCADCAKCLQTAAEKGVDIDARSFRTNADDLLSLKISSFWEPPILVDRNFHLFGVLAVMSYLDDKGFGPLLVPRNGIQRSRMYQSVNVVMGILQPAIRTRDSGKINKCFDFMDNQLKSSAVRGDYLAGPFTLADIHAAACCHILEMKGEKATVRRHPSVSSWLDRVKEHPSTSKEDVIPYSFLPTKQDVDAGKMRDVVIP